MHRDRDADELRAGFHRFTIGHLLALLATTGAAIVIMVAGIPGSGSAGGVPTGPNGLVRPGPARSTPTTVLPLTLPTPTTTSTPTTQPAVVVHPPATTLPHPPVPPITVPVPPTTIPVPVKKPAPTNTPVPTTSTPTTQPLTHAGAAVLAPAAPTTSSSVPTTQAPLTPAPTTTTTTTTTTGASPPVIASDCSADVSAVLGAYLNSLPSGAVFTSPPGTCYLVNEGVVILQPLTINGGIWQNSRNDGTGDRQGYRPIISVRDTSNVTLENLTVEGANTTPGPKWDRVNEAGIKVLSSDHVTITNVSSLNTFGDGLELVADLGSPLIKHHPHKWPDSYITVNGFTSVRNGRTGITVAEVRNSTFNNIYLYDSATPSIDFESDLPGVGSGDVSFSNVIANHAIYVIETLFGPISFDHVAMSNRFHLTNKEHVLVTFSNGSFNCLRPVVCVHVTDGTLNVVNSTVTFKPGTTPIVNPTGYYASPPGVIIWK